MFYACVVGRIWATRKHPSLEGLKLLLVQKLDSTLDNPKGQMLMAVEKGIGAGVGDTVLVLDEGSSARQILEDQTAPVRTIIVAVIDAICLHGSRKRFN